jgi:hypothetical protein
VRDKTDHFFAHLTFYWLPVDERGVKCVGCSEKADFVKKCEETDNMEL